MPLSLLPASTLPDSSFPEPPEMPIPIGRPPSSLSSTRFALEDCDSSNAAHITNGSAHPGAGGNPPVTLLALIRLPLDPYRSSRDPVFDTIRPDWTFSSRMEVPTLPSTWTPLAD